MEDPNDSKQKDRIESWRKAIPQIVESCQEKDITCWLEGGTLLGAYRNGDVIPYDWSAYLSFFKDDFDNVKKTLEVLVSNSDDYSLEDWSMRNKEDVSEKTYLRMKLIKADTYVELCFYEKNEEKNEVKWIDPYPQNKEHIEWHPPVKEELMFPLKTINFNGQELPAPAKTRDYLLFRYGDIRPLQHYNVQKEKYENTSGDEYIKQQQSLMEKHLPVRFEDVYAKFEGSYAGLPLTEIPENKKKHHEQWKNVVIEINKLFDKVGIDSWVDAGTLIGVYRYKDGAIIPWDHDADIATFQANFQKIFELFTMNDRKLREKFGIKRKDFPILNRKKFKIEDWSKECSINGRDESRKNFLRLKLIEFNDYLDIYMVQINPDQPKTVSWIEPYPKDMPYMSWHKSIPRDRMFPLKKAKFYGVDVKVPCQTKLYLEMLYGDLKPNKVWDPGSKSYIDDQNHEYNNNPIHYAVKE